MPDLLIEDVNPYRTRRASLLAEDGNLYLYVSALSGTGDDLNARTVGPEEQVKLSQELYRILGREPLRIGTIGLTPMVQGVVVTNTKFRNVPTTLGNDWPLRSPGNARTEQFYFTK